MKFPRLGKPLAELLDAVCAAGHEAINGRPPFRRVGKSNHGFANLVQNLFRGFLLHRTLIPQSGRTITVFVAVGALTSCAAPTQIASAASCAALLPPTWKQGVAGADLPNGGTVGDWIAFADAQTGKLDTANDRTTSAIGIIERCEARDAQALKNARRGFFSRIFQ